MANRTISINRAPVLTLWAALVAQRLGFDEDEALSLARFRQCEFACPASAKTYKFANLAWHHSTAFLAFGR